MNENKSKDVKMIWDGKYIYTKLVFQVRKFFKYLKKKGKKYFMIPAELIQRYNLSEVFVR